MSSGHLSLSVALGVSSGHLSLSVALCQVDTSHSVLLCVKWTPLTQCCSVSNGHLSLSVALCVSSGYLSLSVVVCVKWTPLTQCCCVCQVDTSHLNCPACSVCSGFLVVRLPASEPSVGMCFEMDFKKPNNSLRSYPRSLTYLQYPGWRWVPDLSPVSWLEVGP